MGERLMVIDGNSLIHRAFYAMPAMTTPDGRPSNAIFGFLNMLLRAMEDYDPQYLAVAFDRHGPTFRHGEYAEYKAGRRATPEDMRPQIPMLRELLTRMGIATVDGEGYEADDYLGTLAAEAERKGLDTVLITGDRDALQLIDDHTLVALTRKGVSEIEAFDRAHLQEVYDLRPDQIPDLKGLMGDASDNIPGIAGVGEKTALTLLHTYGTVEEVLAHAGELKGKLAEKVQNGAESARFSKWLATICRDAPMTLTLTDTALRPWGESDAFAALEELGMRSVLARLRQAAGAEEQKTQLAAVDVQPVEDTPALTALAARLACEDEVALTLGEGLSLAIETEEYRVELQRDLLSLGLEPDDAFKACEALLSAGAGKVVHDAKAWMGLLRPLDIALEPLAFDTMIAGYLLNPVGGKYDFAGLCERTLGTAPDDAPATALRALAARQRELLRQQGMWDLFETMELPLISVLADMEAIGFRLDSDVLRRLGAEHEARLAELTKTIYELAGGPFNINSTRQLGELLFEKLGLPAARKTKTGYSTDAEVLEQLADAHPIIPAILEYRQLSKLKSTYIDGLLPLVRGSGRVHTTLHQTIASTGRISSSEPNLQNIPVRTDMGRAIRKAFVAADEAHILVDGDYSQIELRVLAHMAGDERMQEAFRQGADIHRQTASQVFGVPPAEVTSAQRSSAKAVNFGIVYGISDFGLARQLGITRAQARDYIDRYLDTFSGVRRYMEDTVRQGRELGYVTTLFGRRRPMPELKSANYNTRSFGERVAMNAPIQGTAADIIKLAMVKVHRELDARGFRSRLILQVHDELILDCPREEADSAAALLIECMESVAELAVPLKADVSQGFSWYDAK